MAGDLDEDRRKVYIGKKEVFDLGEMLIPSL